MFRARCHRCEESIAPDRKTPYLHLSSPSAMVKAEKWYEGMQRKHHRHFLKQQATARRTSGANAAKFSHMNNDSYVLCCKSMGAHT